jgi:hypothetical protein
MLPHPPKKANVFFFFFYIYKEDRVMAVSSSTADKAGPSMRRRRRRLSGDGLQISAARSMDRVAGVAASMLVLGSETARPPRGSSVSGSSQRHPALNDRPFLSRQATIGRNSQFHNLTSHDLELLGGIVLRLYE